jgi:signal transduction histidine kinase
LKNIFGIIKGWTQLAQYNQDAGDSSDEEIKNCVNGLEKAQILIERLLNFTKNSSTATLELDLNQVITNFGEKFAKLIVSTDIHLNMQFTSNLPPITANVSELDQLLLNLVLNAQYAILHKEPPSLPKIIEIKTGTVKRLKRKTKNYVTLEVSDTGMGMTPKTLKKIFNPFFTTKLGSDGSGLGLSSILKIVRANQGEIRVKSQPNFGTTFTIYWPESTKR